ncbi:hypothetical protein HZZ00_11130 [Streptomyces sp. NEAU-sy36]|uniref:hypothetical protein n=1 Tax=unclassified Streptomyces TaxID=2593676 RepID=UPI0015D60FEF|nr:MULTISPECIES: hypothetical protein [unclassified Streptomyces]QLJ01524.1 hypothetical protein HZZ00_11130 [Streptomyces sp. NEAU-sy36]
MAMPLPDEHATLTLVPPIESAPVFKDEPTVRKPIESVRKVAETTNRVAQLALLPHTFRGYRELGRRWLDRYHNHYPQLIASADRAVREAAGDVHGEAQAKKLADGYRADYRQHRKTFLTRTAGVAGAVGGGLGIGVATGSLWLDLLAGLGAFGLGAFHGRDRSASVEGTGDLLAPYGLQDSDLVLRDHGQILGEADLVTALIKAGIVTEAQRSETRLVGIIQSAGPGWTATVELPGGMKASTAISRAEELASALRVKKSQVEMRADLSEDGHEGRFVLWVANEANPYGTNKVPSPLLTHQVWNFWRDGVPLGTDARGGRHALELVWCSILLGGLPDYGKSFLARLVAAAAALDPHMTVHVATGKAGPDWVGTKQFAHSYVAGNTPEKILAFFDLLNELIADMQEIGQRLEDLSEEHPERCPEGKLTPELAKEWKRGLTLLIVDELQELLDAAAMMKIKTDDDPEGKDKGRNGKEVLVETMARFVRVSRYVGGMGLFITQRPDATSVPTLLREVCRKRACFRVKGAESSRMVLGNDAVAAGAAPHMLLDAQKGVVVLDQGGEEGHVTLKTDFMTIPEFREICLRGRQLRIDAGTLTGFAAEHGKTDTTAAARKVLLDDCLAVLEADGVDRARTKRLLELLTAYRPDRYQAMSETDLQARLREAGAGGTRKLGPLDGMANPNGYTREQFTEALDK